MYEATWRAPRFHFVIGKVSMRESIWYLWDSLLPPCITLSYLQGLIVHLPPSYGCLFLAHCLMNRHIRGQRLWISCRYYSACMLAQSYSWGSASSSVQPPYIPATQRIFFVLPVLRISKYAILTNFTYGVGVFAASANSTPSSIFSINSTIKSRRDHSWFISCSLSSMSMGGIDPWSS